MAKQTRSEKTDVKNPAREEESFGGWSLDFAQRVPGERIRALNDQPIVPARPVLYLMMVQHRLSWNFAIDRALEVITEFGLPGLHIVQALPPYQPRTARHVKFWLEAAAEMEKSCEGLSNGHSVVNPDHFDSFCDQLQRAGQSLSLVVVDDHPFHEYREFLEKLAATLPCRAEAVDSCGLIPLRVAPRAFPTARGFRSFARGVLPRWLAQLPNPKPLPERLKRRKHPEFCPPSLSGTFSREALWDIDALLAELRVDRSVVPVRAVGGSIAAQKRWKRFLAEKIMVYDEERNHPDAEATSGLSAYIHFGMISPFEMAWDIFSQAENRLQSVARTSSEPESCWFGLPPGMAEFFDQLAVWREIGFNFCEFNDQYKTWDSLPDWAKRTLTRHQRDPRPRLYSIEELEHSQTDDPLWNAAQTELREEGALHNYLRMVWGKKILEWTATPQEALEVMILLNDKYGLDGTDPNSYTGICWILGRYDRPWGPERPIFGTIRYMTTASAMRKLRLKKYLQKFGGQGATEQTLL